MDFFDRQRRLRAQSRRLVWLFGMAVVAIVLAVNLALLAALAVNAPQAVLEHGGALGYAAQRPGVFLFATLLTLAVIVLSSLGKIASLREGGGAVARQLGGTPVPGDSRDPQLRRLRNVVEEIAIAASVPVPEIYVLEHEPGINAFAAGYAPTDAAVAVTRGALQRLNRDELQGVIAHEFSHILNGDMRLNIHLMGVLFGILVLGIIGQRVLIHGRAGGRDRNAGAVLIVALAVMVVGYVGLFFGRLIKAGISRQREFLADASAVQFTRQSAGIAGALKKIGGMDEGARLATPQAEEVSHMLFGDGVGYSALFATHPPLLERIRALDPSFDARALESLAVRWQQSPPDGLAEDLAMGLAPAGAAPLPAAGQEGAIDAGALRGRVGAVAEGDYRQADVLLADLPVPLRESAASQAEAPAVLLGLLLDASAEVRARQLAQLQAALGPALARAAEGCFAASSGLHPMLRLPLAALAFPALRRRPRGELSRLVECVEALLHADGRIDLFEYCLARLLQKQVIESLDPSRHRPGGRRKLSASSEALADVLAVLAWHGHADADAAQRAFQAGMQRALPRVHRAYAAPADWVARLDRALPLLDALDPAGKALVLEAMVHAGSHDGRITVAEAELLRLFAALLHLPLPAQLGGAGAPAARP